MNNSEKIWDVCVVGAGAAGLMTSILAARSGHRVLLLDSKEKPGAKILMSGGTRCNITNQTVTENDFESEKKNILKAPLRSYTSEETLDFFREIGVEVVTEAGGKYFPSTHSGRTVLEALLSEIKKRNVQLESPRKVTRLSFNQAADAFDLEGDGFNFQAKAVVLTTGGLSFPATGSDGSGYAFAKQFGHRLVETTPSLTPLLTDDSDWKKISGVSLPVKLTCEGGNKKSFTGSFLFTHLGFSGPVVLNLSRYWIRDRSAGKQIFANFLPEHDEQSFRTDFQKAVSAYPARQLASILSEGLPARFVDTLLTKLGFSGETVLNQVKREDRERLATTLFRYPLPVSGDQGYAKAEVTAGGIALDEVDKNTMASGKQCGLFFAGEILDVDGRIGGFNFQWAWSSGVAAARGVSTYLKTASG